MNRVREQLRRFLRSEEGPTATEYAVLIALICIAVISALSSFGSNMDGIYTSLASGVDVF